VTRLGTRTLHNPHVVSSSPPPLDPTRVVDTLHAVLRLAVLVNTSLWSLLKCAFPFPTQPFNGKRMLIPAEFAR
jgi:hypothetical protein